MDSIIRKVLKRYFKSFLKDFDTNNLKFDLLSGFTVIRNVEINEVAVQQLLQIPLIYVKRAFIDSIVVRHALTKLQSKPIVIEIGRVEIHLQEHLPGESFASQSKLVASLKKKLDKALEEKAKKTSSKKEKKKSKKQYGMADRIGDGIAVELREMRIVVHTLGKEPTAATGPWRPPSLDIILRGVRMYTTDGNWNVISLKKAIPSPSKDDKEVVVRKEGLVDSVSISLLASAEEHGLLQPHAALKIVPDFPMKLRMTIRKAATGREMLALHMAMIINELTFDLDAKSLDTFSTAIGGIARCVFRMDAYKEHANTPDAPPVTPSSVSIPTPLPNSAQYKGSLPASPSPNNSNSLPLPFSTYNYASSVASAGASSSSPPASPSPSHPSSSFATGPLNEFRTMIEVQIHRLDVRYKCGAARPLPSFLSASSSALPAPNTVYNFVIDRPLVEIVMREGCSAFESNMGLTFRSLSLSEHSPSPAADSPPPLFSIQPKSVSNAIDVMLSQHPPPASSPSSLGLAFVHSPQTPPPPNPSSSSLNSKKQHTHPSAFSFSMDSSSVSSAEQSAAFTAAKKASVQGTIPWCVLMDPTSPLHAKVSTLCSLLHVDGSPSPLTTSAVAKALIQDLKSALPSEWPATLSCDPDVPITPSPATAFSSLHSSFSPPLSTHRHSDPHHHHHRSFSDPTVADMTPPPKPSSSPILPPSSSSHLLRASSSATKQQQQQAPNKFFSLFSSSSSSSKTPPSDHNLLHSSLSMPIAPSSSSSSPSFSSSSTPERNPALAAHFHSADSSHSNHDLEEEGEVDWVVMDDGVDDDDSSSSYYSGASPSHGGRHNHPCLLQPMDKEYEPCFRAAITSRLPPPPHSDPRSVTEMEFRALGPIRFVLDLARWAPLLAEILCGAVAPSPSPPPEIPILQIIRGGLPQKLSMIIFVECIELLVTCGEKTATSATGSSPVMRVSIGPTLIMGDPSLQLPSEWKENSLLPRFPSPGVGGLDSRGRCSSLQSTFNHAPLRLCILGNSIQIDLLPQAMISFDHRHHHHHFLAPMPFRIDLAVAERLPIQSNYQKRTICGIRSSDIVLSLDSSNASTLLHLIQNFTTLSAPLDIPTLIHVLHFFKSRSHIEQHPESYPVPHISSLASVTPPPSSSSLFSSPSLPVSAIAVTRSLDEHVLTPHHPNRSRPLPSAEATILLLSIDSLNVSVLGSPPSSPSSSSSSPSSSPAIICAELHSIRSIIELYQPNPLPPSHMPCITLRSSIHNISVHSEDSILGPRICLLRSILPPANAADDSSHSIEIGASISIPSSSHASPSNWNQIYARVRNLDANLQLSSFSEIIARLLAATAVSASADAASISSSSSFVSPSWSSFFSSAVSLLTSLYPGIKTASQGIFDSLPHPLNTALLAACAAADAAAATHITKLLDSSLIADIQINNLTCSISEAPQSSLFSFVSPSSASPSAFDLSSPQYDSPLSSINACIPHLLLSFSSERLRNLSSSLVHLDLQFQMSTVQSVGIGMEPITAPFFGPSSLTASFSVPSLAPHVSFVPSLSQLDFALDPAPIRFNTEALHRSWFVISSNLNRLSELSSVVKSWMHLHQQHDYHHSIRKLMEVAVEQSLHVQSFSDSVTWFLNRLGLCTTTPSSSLSSSAPFAAALSTVLNAFPSLKSTILSAVQEKHDRSILEDSIPKAPNRFKQQDVSTPPPSIASLVSLRAPKEADLDDNEASRTVRAYSDIESRMKDCYFGSAASVAEDRHQDSTPRLNRISQLEIFAAKNRLKELHDLLNSAESDISVTKQVDAEDIESRQKALLDLEQRLASALQAVRSQLSTGPTPALNLHANHY